MAGMWLMVPLVIALIVVSIWWNASRSREILDRWATENGMRILEVERRYFWRGPFWFRTGEGHEVFRVTVATPSGATRSGYVRVGGWFTGLFSSKAVVEWDD